MKAMCSYGVPEMSIDLETASRYRQHAEELRIAATESPLTRKALLTIAAEYEQLAARLEAVDKTNKAMAKRLEN